MVNLKQFYQENITENDYYYRFYSFIITNEELVRKEMEEVFGGYDSDFLQQESIFEVFDEEEAIKKFKDLCEPNLSFYNNENAPLFYLVCFYLYKNGYQIKEFPRLLERPPKDPTEFTVNDIRNRAFELKLNEDNTVKYQTRRRIVAELHFEKTITKTIDEDINVKFQEISTRNARFENMSTDEKIKEIINLIENLLKENGKYVKLDYNTIALGTIDDKTIVDFKNKIQCFRHSSDEALKERKSFSDNQKKFIIEYGIMLCNLIYYNKK